MENQYLKDSAPEFQKSPVLVVCKQLQLDWDRVPTLLGHGTSPGKSACDRILQYLHGSSFGFVKLQTCSSDQDTLATGYFAQTSADIQSFSDLR